MSTREGNKFRAQRLLRRKQFKYIEVSSYPLAYCTFKNYLSMYVPYSY
jgi:hypothetical protein